MPPTHPNQVDRIHPVDTESFSFLNELSEAFRSGESNPRPSHFPVLEGIRAVLAHLHSAGRLIPAGGMALTAEQVEDVRTVAFTKSGSDTYLLAGETVDRLRALFPATEPAKVATQSAGGDCFDVCEGHPVETPDAAGTPIRLTLGTDEITEPWSRTDFAVMSEVGDRVFEIDWDRGGVEEVLDCIVGGRLVTRDVHYGAW